jgi:exonuclease III
MAAAAHGAASGLKNLAHLSFSSQNCNSLNISTSCPKQSKKITAILSLQATIIFLSDIRLNTEAIGFNNLFSPRYDMIHHSKKSKRGVGILISRTLQYTVLKEYRDTNNNVLAVKLNTCDTNIILISVYGPNNNDFEFFSFIRKVLSENTDSPAICGGDWNATYCTEAGELNLDTFNMQNPPSITRSGWLAGICNDFNLFDPFRTMHYNKKDFTYVPRSGNKNRSRIDFFLISGEFLSMCNKCTISP